MWNRHAPSGSGAVARNSDGTGRPPIARTAITLPSAIKLITTIQVAKCGVAYRALPLTRPRVVQYMSLRPTRFAYTKEWKS